MSAWAQTLLLWSWQSLLLVGFVLAVVRIARSQSASSRHSFWLLAVLVISVLPVVSAIVRALPVAPPAVAPISYIAELPAVAVDALPLTGQPASSTRDFITPSLFAIWSTGVLISAVRLFRTNRRWRRIVRSASSVEKANFPIPVGYSTEVEAPVLVGTLRPMVVLPANIETWTTGEERRAVLLHELAHFERRDHWVSPVQAFLGAVFFFHPAVRYALRMLVLERELACDEHVLSMGTNPAAYAEIILRVAEHSIPGRRPDECPAFNSPGKILERRIEMILSYQSLVSGRWYLPALLRVTTVLSLTTLLLPQHALTAVPPLVRPPEIRVAAFQPLVPRISPAARALTKEAPAEPVQAQPAQAAQAVLATVSGTISDPSGAVVREVMVTLIAASTEPSRTVSTDGTGQFAFPQVVDGQYTLQARSPGFSIVERKIVVRSGEPSVQNFSLPVNSIETFVYVRASRATPSQNSNNRPPPLRVGGDIVQPRLISQVKPQYPAGARASGVQDFVQLRAIIGKDGTLISLQVDPIRPGTGNPDLVKAAMDAVQQWRYTPGMLNGAPIEIATTINVSFALLD